MTETRLQPAALYQVRAGVAIITLNRPGPLNFVNAALSTAVGEAIERAAADSQVGVVVVTGADLALVCDLVIAADTAVFGLPEVKRGLLAAGGVSRLQRQVPLRRALELALTGDGIDAETAASWGLVNKVVPASAVLDAALDMAHRIAANAPLSLQHTKKMVYRTATSASEWKSDWARSDPWQVNAEVRGVVFSSEDDLEGHRAFAEKRAPEWSGRCGVKS